MHCCISSSQHGYSFFLASSPCQKHRHYPSQYWWKDPLIWYRLSNGRIAKQSGQLWWWLHWICPGGADRAAQQIFNCLSSFVAATEACIWFPAVPPEGGSAIASSSETVPCGETNSNSNHNTNITSIGNMALVNECTIVVGAMSPGG